MLLVLAYARVTGVPRELLVDDDIDLPEPLPRLGITGSHTSEPKRVSAAKLQHEVGGSSEAVMPL